MDFDFEKKKGSAGISRLTASVTLCKMYDKLIKVSQQNSNTILFVLLQPDDVVNVATNKINNLLESFMGINDSELGKLNTVGSSFGLTPSTNIIF